ncbi:polysaccharide deacetylase family protein [Oceanispirochaeta sp.]|jgi:peptidoglycan/xylan/chitin deacetylase (PgdA/CDA1 family)|uniref:polysaccharide deacetylase family protein n=1 Tax=Oceanispirochaeta sp. TaxID=2035350 RepID=UPI0026241C26|nr:polysaccharide deacetylase family protein [Oceanispirochaeta sp.]MDA3956958.1 polysaccharide deacetylase family protein [Oceanispirochaeta sp.]
MAKIVKIKSMGNAAWYKDKIADSRIQKKLPERDLKLFLKKRTIQARFFVLFLTLSLFLFIYCRTVPPINKSGTTALQTAVVPEENNKSKDPIVHTHYPVPALENLNAIMNLNYPGDQLQGVFWGEHDFNHSVYLTFDDGPNLSEIEQFGTMTTVSESILDALKYHGLQSVFFINGKNLEYSNSHEKDRLKEVLMRMINEGHLIGNHSYHHHNLAQGIFNNGLNDSEEIGREFTLTQTVLDEILGFSYPLVLVRPPYAEPGRTRNLDQWLIQERQYLISLQFDSYDYAYKADGRWNEQGIMNRMSELLDDDKKGGVLLLHELENSALMLPDLLDKVILEKGYEIESMESLLEKKYGRES